MFTKPKIIIPIPHQDFDPSEVAVTWKLLRDRGFDVYFATPDGARGYADPLMLSGEGLDLWGRIPYLNHVKVLGLVLRANGRARAAYTLLERDLNFLNPLAYASLAVPSFNGLVLPGGHRARGMKVYLEDKALQRFVAEFFDSGRPVAAVCHGVVLAARSISSRTGKSVLHGRKTVALTWEMENQAWSLMKYVGRCWDPDYYRTYGEAPSEPVGYRGVQAEVTRALASASDFVDVPKDAEHHFRKSSGIFRDTERDSRAAWVVTDGNYVSARWPGDLHAMTAAFAAKVSAAMEIPPA